MLRRLMETIKRGFKGIGKNGYTLVEVAAVVAVTAGLMAVVVPVAVEKAKDSKLVGAKLDCIKIGGAINGFVGDTGQMPAYDKKNGKDYFYVLRSGINDLNKTPNPQYNLSKLNSYITKADYLENHLIRDNPGGSYGEKNDGYLQTFKINWKGPYVESLTKTDPWGNNYFVYIKAMHTPTTGTNKEFGWIISAGPNGELETDFIHSSLQGDDIGVMLYAAETGH